MQIDWFTVIAQVVNFLLLVWLLKRFLYGPILNAIDQREERVTRQLKIAESEMAEAERLQQEFTSKNQQFDQEREQKMEQVRSEAETMKMELMQKAKAEAESLADRLRSAKRFEHEQERHKAIDRIGQELMTTIGQVLNDLADLTLEEGTLNVFLRHLASLDDNEKRTLKIALAVNEQSLMVNTSFDLTTEQRNSLSDAVVQVVGNEMRITFGVKPELIAGVELVVNGYRLSWSVSEYLKSLEGKLADPKEAEGSAKARSDEQ